jgi:hypothetical protein
MIAKRSNANFMPAATRLAAAQADLRAARAELENFKVLRAADEAAKLELAGRRTLTEAAAAQRDAGTPLR